MKLQDFLEDDSLNDLRDRMGTQVWGSFELFDPGKHTTHEERDRLSKQGLLVDLSALNEAHNRTLCYRDCRVAVLCESQAVHLSYCDALQGSKRQGLKAFTSFEAACCKLDGPLAEPLSICMLCVQRLNQVGGGRRRNRQVEDLNLDLRSIESSLELGWLRGNAL